MSFHGSRHPQLVGLGTSKLLGIAKAGSHGGAQWMEPGAIGGAQATDGCCQEE